MRHRLAVKAPESHPIKCRGCSRTVKVILSDCFPPRFHYFGQQVDCPEIRSRRQGGEGSLLAMMCGALSESLAKQLECAEVKPVVHEGSWQVVCRVEDDRAQFYSPSQAMVQADFWRRCGQMILADRFHEAADRAEARTLGARGAWRTPAAVTIVAVCVAAIAAAGHLHGRRIGRTNVAASSNAPKVSDRQLIWKRMEQLSDGDVGPVTKNRSLGSKEISSPAALPSHHVLTVPIRPLSPLVVKEPDMIPVAGGIFAMGSDREGSEMPIHKVAIKPFEMSKFPITVGQWKDCVAAKVCEYVPAGEDDAPVANVSWSDTKQFIAWLVQKTQKNYRLPSEAEWEYAARGGTEAQYWWGDQLRAGMADCRGCGKTYAEQPTRVGGFAANPFGLYDMGGGVDQWVEDCWHNGYRGAPIDGSPWTEAGCGSHVIRSGSWENDPSYVRSASRDHYDTDIRYPTHGFRIARSP
jgi:formylglycine-generating enzyme required for sulfatase activity